MSELRIEALLDREARDEVQTYHGGEEGVCCEGRLSLFRKTGRRR